MNDMRWAIGRIRAVIIADGRMRHHPLAIVEIDSQQKVLLLQPIFNDSETTDLWAG